MKIINLHFEDDDLFSTNVDKEKFSLLQSQPDIFKKMWISQGKTFWLRFLLTFENAFYDCIDVVTLATTPQRVFSFTFICIHKQIVEADANVAKQFIEHLIIVIIHFLDFFCEGDYSELDVLSRISLDDPKTKDAFTNIFGAPKFDDRLPPDIIFSTYYLYMNFYNALASLLRSWISESELSMEEEKNVDNQVLYWMPDPNWLNDNFRPTCFNRYLADLYKDELPKLLLTCNIHNTFSNHKKLNCCEHFQNDLNIFKSLKDLKESPEIKAFGIIRPLVESCCTHSHCQRKIRHDIGCTEPFICEGNKLCLRSCETNLRNTPVDPKENTQLWKTFLIETYSCKKNKRTVATLAESFNNNVETFVHTVYEHHLDFLDHNSSCFGPEMLNSYHQFQKKISMKARLKKKLSKKQNCSASNIFNFPLENLENPVFQLLIREKAQRLMKEYLLLDKCKFFYEKLKKTANKVIAKNKENVLPDSCLSFTTIAVSTRDVVYGTVVKSSFSSDTGPVSCNCTVPALMEKKFKTKKSRSRKKEKQAKNSFCVTKEDLSRCEESPNLDIKTNDCHNRVENVIAKIADNVSKPNTFLEHKLDINPLANVTKETGLEKFLDLLEDSLADSDGSFECSDMTNSNSNVPSKEQMNEIQTSLMSLHTLKEQTQQQIESSLVSQEILKFSKLKTNAVSPEGGKPAETFEQFKSENAVIEAKHTVIPDKNDKNVEAFFNLLRSVNTVISDKVEENAKAPLKYESIKKELDPQIVKHVKTTKLRICAYCQSQEPKRKTYKICARCLEEKFYEQRYYCSLDCQIEDWEERHREEHLKKSLKMS